MFHLGLLFGHRLIPHLFTPADYRLWANALWHHSRPAYRNRIRICSRRRYWYPCHGSALWTVGGGGDPAGGIAAAVQCSADQISPLLCLSFISNKCSLCASIWASSKNFLCSISCLISSIFSICSSIAFFSRSTSISCAI